VVDLRNQKRYGVFLKVMFLPFGKEFPYQGSVAIGWMDLLIAKKIGPLTAS